MRYSVFTVSTPQWDPETAVAKLAEIGFEGVEWRVVDQSPSPDGTPGFWSGNRCTWPLSTLREDAPRIRQLTEAYGLAIPSLGTYVPCGDLGSVELAMEGAVAVGAPALRVTAPAFDKNRPYLAQRDEARRQYREVAHMARRYGVRALMEIHMGNLVPSASAAAAFVEGMDPDCVGVIHDAGNMVYEGYEDYRLGLGILGPYLAHVHLKSAKWEAVGVRADGSLEWRPSFAPLRRGMVDVSGLFQALHAVGYTGWISFEDFSTETPLEERLRDNLAYARECEHRSIAG